LSEEGMRQILDTQYDILTNTMGIAPNEAARKDILVRMENCAIQVIRSYLTSDKREERITAAVADVEKELSETEDDNLVLTLLERMDKLGQEADDKYIASLTDAVIRHHQLFKNYLKKVNEIVEEAMEGGGDGQAGDGDDDDDDEGEEEEEDDDEIDVPTIDPITKGPLENPVKNKKCGHYYGRIAIMELIKSNARSKCPYAGCPNKEYLRQVDLVADKAMEKKIKHAQKNQNKGRRKKSVVL